MSAFPPPERDRKMGLSGGWLLATGFAAIVVAVVLLLVGVPVGVAAAIGFLGAVPLMAGIMLTLSAAVSKRSRAGKPFA